MFERFTERARQVVVLAQEEARRTESDRIDSGHILTGLLLEQEGLAARVLESMDVTVEWVVGQRHNDALLLEREALSEGHDRAFDVSAGGVIPFTLSAKKVLELALREALSLGHNYIGTEHLLLGLLRVDEIGSVILHSKGLNAERVRSEVIRLLSGPQGHRRVTEAVVEDVHRVGAGHPRAGDGTYQGLAARVDELAAQVKAIDDRLYREHRLVDDIAADKEKTVPRPKLDLEAAARAMLKAMAAKPGDPDEYLRALIDSLDPHGTNPRLQALKPKAKPGKEGAPNVMVIGVNEDNPRHVTCNVFLADGNATIRTASWEASKRFMDLYGIDIAFVKALPDQAAAQEWKDTFGDRVVLYRIGAM